MRGRVSAKASLRYSVSGIMTPRPAQMEIRDKPADFPGEEIIPAIRG